MVYSKVRKVDERVVVLLDFIAMRDTQNDGASGTIQIQISNIKYE